jgi:uncharacterized protein
MADALDVMQQSPLDTPTARALPSALVQLSRTPQPGDRRGWVPSRFNARTVAPDGRMVIWNTLNGTMTVFEEAQVPLVEELLSQQGFRAPEKGIVKYLRERGLIVPHGTSEKQRLQYLFGKQQYRTDILALILMTSEDCNFRCVYCYEDFARGTMKPEVREGIKALVGKRLPLLSDLSISYFGGEPLYGFEAVEDLAPFFQKTARDNDLRLACHMTTNGYLLTPDVADRVLGWDIRDFQITLDGPAEFHDQKRKGRDGSGTFENIFRNLRALKAREDEKFKVTLRVNYDRENAPALPDFVRMVGEQFGGDPRFQLSFHAIGQWGGDNDANLDVCGMNEEKRVRKEMNMAAIGEGFETRGIGSMIRPGNGVCYAARPFNFLIGSDGKVMKCTVALDKHDYNVVGQIDAEGDLHLDIDKMALWTEPAFENDSGCAKCYMVPVCQGMHCPMVRIEQNQRPCPPQKRQLNTALLETYEAGRTRRTPTLVTAEAE